MKGEKKTRGLAILALLLAAACAKPADKARTGPAAAAAQGHVICAVDGATAFSRDCIMERTASAEGLTLTIRHPDGGFRKLLVARDGRGVIAADGAARAIVRVTGDREIEVAVGGDRYRLPATVKGKPLR